MNLSNFGSKESLLFLLFLVLVLPSLPNSAQALWPKTETDFSMLPPYCKVRSKENRYPQQARKWKAILGKSTFLHIHHYCAGLLSLLKAESSIPPNLALLGTALREFRYVDEKWPHNSKLRPEMLVKRGDTLILLGRTQEGFSQYQAAMRLKPGYSLPYLRMADYFLKSGNLEQARKWLEIGHEKAPRSKKIPRKLEELTHLQNSGK